MLRSAYVGSVVISLAASLASSARAQCLDFAEGFETAGVVKPFAANSTPDPFAAVYATAIFDDGSGEALYVAGRFAHTSTNDVSAIARWDGSTWSYVATGLPGGAPFTNVRALAVYDDGTGPALYAGGNMKEPNPSSAGGVAKWDGTTWSVFGGGISLSGISFEVRALAVYDSGSGPELYAGGNFGSAGGAPAASIARWNDITWSPCGSGVSSGGLPAIQSLHVYDDGGGAKLYVGGAFLSAGGLSSSRALARWDGSGWSTIPTNSAHVVNCMTIYDDGGGPALFIGGTFFGGTQPGIGKWDGTTFTSTNGPGVITGLGVFDDGSGHGRELYAGGYWTGTMFGVAARGIVRYDGKDWRAAGPGLGVVLGANPEEIEVHTIRKFADVLFVGGTFANSGSLAVNGIATWNGTSWSALGSGHGLDGNVHAFATHDDGTGPALYAAGQFRSAGSAEARHVAKWDGTGWARIGATGSVSFGPVLAMAWLPNVSGDQLFIGGGDAVPGFSPNGFAARFDGTTWSSAPGLAFLEIVRAMCVYDPPGATGPELYAGGDFIEVERWNGSTFQTSTSTNGSVSAMTVHDDGTGPKLYIGGAFTQVAGMPAAGAACFDGTSWTPVGGGPGWPVSAFASYHDGSASLAGLYAAMYVVDTFSTPHYSVRRWNGSTWSVVADTNIGGVIDALAVSGDGTSDRPSLYVGGKFTALGGVAAENVARWNGNTWSAVGGADGRVRALCAFGDGTDAAPDLYLGGEFEHAGGAPARGIAKYQGCTGPGTPYCFADGTLATACPCAAPFTVPNPQGSAFAGCANSFNPHGGSLSAVGATNPDTVTLHATGLTPSGFTMFIKSDALVSAGFAAHDGVRCTGGAFVRFGGQVAVNGTARYPNPALGFTLPLSFVSGTPPGSGLSAFYQPFYRNVTPNFCSAGTINYTNTYGVVWN